MSELAKLIAAEIQKQGPIPFARFMDLALYCPVYGYYEKEADTVGPRGDYYTSVSVGGLFGELLAAQFAAWLDGLRARWPGQALTVVEGGAHRGELAREILGRLREHYPALSAGLAYCLLEPSERRQSWQRQTLRHFLHQVRWARTWDAVGQIRGVVFSNELLDAFPVHRLAWDAARREWFEWGVNLAGHRFVWARLPSPASGQPPRPAAFPPALEKVMPDGFTIDLCPTAARWWRQAAASLRCGKLVTIDYGLTGEEAFLPERQNGTLRAYRRHRVTTDVLADPGEQDLTAHVDFSALQNLGQAAGLVTEAFVSQSQFLTAIACRSWNAEIPFPEWTPGRRRQFQTLTHPEHLGRRFLVLIQSRDTPGPASPMPPDDPSTMSFSAAEPPC